MGIRANWKLGRKLGVPKFFLEKLEWKIQKNKEWETVKRGCGVESYVFILLETLIILWGKTL